MRNHHKFRWFYSLVGLTLLAFSLGILSQELSRYNFADIWHGLSQISSEKLSWALIFTLLNYIVISSHDLIAFRHLNYYLEPKKIFFTTFITYAISNTTGFTLLIGGGVRYRFYSLWKVPPKVVAKITGFGNLTFWLGLLFLSGIVFIANPLKLPQILNLEALALRYLGSIALGVVFSYFYCCWHHKGLRIGNRILTFPRIAISLAQITVFTLDWALAAAVFYNLLPDYLNQSYPQFFSVYLLAMAASMMSNIPGGIGVFETIIIFLLPRDIFPPDIIGSLLVYRVIRFLLPLIGAFSLICSFEMWRKLRSLKSNRG